MKTINILIADDFPIVRNGLKYLLKDCSDIKVLAEANNGAEAIAKINEIADISMVLMDVNMPIMDGIEATKKLKETHPHIKVLALSVAENEEYISQMIQNGASGYILKKTSKAELLIAIRNIANGSTYFSSEVSSVLINGYLNKDDSSKRTAASKYFQQLTNREMEILKLIVEEKTNQEMAEQLLISCRTVESHRRNILLKLDIRNTAGLVKFAIQHGIVQPRY